MNMTSETESFNDTKKFIEAQIASGRFKVCKCGATIGNSFSVCGQCENAEKMKDNLEEIERIKADMRVEKERAAPPQNWAKRSPIWKEADKGGF